MIRKENLSDLLRKPRELSGPQVGFGSKLPRHGLRHDQRFFETTNGHFFGKPLQASAVEILQQTQRSGSLAAGTHLEKAPREPKPCPLVGEVLRQSKN